jgi:PAS domain S-box-containing protein
MPGNPTSPLPTPDPERFDDELRAEQLRLYDRNVPSAVGGLAFVGALLLVVLRDAVDGMRLLAWGAALVAVLALRLWVWRRSRGELGDAAAEIAQRRRMRVAIMISGAVFGLAGVLLYPAQDLALQYFLTFVLAGVAAGSLTLTPFDPVASRPFAVLALVPLSLQLLLAGPPEGRAVASMTLLFVVFLLVGSARAWHNLRETLRTRLSERDRAEALLQSEQRLQQAAEQLAGKTEALELTLDSMDQAILSLDAQGRLNFHNHRLTELLELPADFLATRPTLEQIARYQAENGHYGPDFELADDQTRPYLQRWFTGERVEFPLSYHRRTRKGRVLEVKTRYVGEAGMVRTFTDVTDYIDAQQRLVESEAQARKLALVAAHTDNAVIIADAELRIEWVNEAFTRISGYSLAEVSGRRAYEMLRAEENDPALAAAFDRTLAEHHRASGELLNRAKDGHVYWVALETQGILDAEGRVVQFVSTASDISERKRAEEALRAARNEAERANRAKSDFLSAMSHELRTPMNAILGFAQLLAADPARRSDERLQRYVDEILRAGRHLLELINDVLDLARVETGGVPLRVEPVPLQALVDDGLRLLEPLAQARSIQWPTAQEIDPQWAVLADRTRLTQVLLNLLSNAIKYNRDGGEVRVDGQADGETIVLRVADNGPGLTPEQQARLFHAFDRLGAEQGPIQGAGIGLVLSKRLVELMGGSIGVDSTPGQGTCFWIRLPAVGVPAPAAPQQLSLLDDEPVAAGARQDRRVLYIEDNPVNVVLMEAMLAQEPGIRLLSAPLPEVGLDLARRERPDLILLDIQLPGMDGFEVLRRLRKDRRTRAIPVVALSANAMPADIDSGLAAGFDAYLTKPVELTTLQDTLARLWRR